ncbi:MAG: hypothetical protein NTW04_03790 [Elusimicrobia bacterium]|nr:hypothetical protein [Elusimicrobiota bacterium]
MIKCLGIFREITNSPNREQDDALILKAVTEELVKLGAQTSLVEPQNIDLIKPAEWDVILPMCENYPALKRIASWEKGPLIINNVSAVLNCYRTNMIPLMEKCPGVHPATELRNIKDIPGRFPSFIGDKGVWLKRGDVHNTCDHDVVFISNWADSAKVREDFQSREITTVAVQENIPGDVIKFYGVGPFKWFDWFYHRPDTAQRHAFNVETLENYAGQVAHAVGLEIYGGDAIITPQGKIYIIDINSWPSFARVRNEVKQHIAKHVFERAVKEKTNAKRDIGKKTNL